jgi:hypothetical protein
MQVFGLQWDSASGDFPERARLKALYVNGLYATKPVKYRRGSVWVDVNGSDPAGAYWLDVERGDATSGQVAAWLDARERLVGGQGGIYCDRSDLAAVEEAAGNRPHSLWVATLDGTASITLPGDSAGKLVAIQDYPASMVGLDADLSIVVDHEYWLAHALP